MTDPITPTRIVVRRPEAAEDFCGAVVVERMNASGGVDAIVEAVTNADAALRTKVGGDADLVTDTHRSMPFEDFETAMRGALSFYD